MARAFVPTLKSKPSTEIVVRISYIIYLITFPTFFLFLFEMIMSVIIVLFSRILNSNIPLILIPVNIRNN